MKYKQFSVRFRDFGNLGAATSLGLPKQMAVSKYFCSEESLFKMESCKGCMESLPRVRELGMWKETSEMTATKPIS